MSLGDASSPLNHKPSQPRTTPTVRGRASLETLPLELHYLIIAKLAPADLHALLLTSRALSAVAPPKLYCSVSLSLG